MKFKITMAILATFIMFEKTYAASFNQLDSQMPDYTLHNMRAGKSFKGLLEDHVDLSIHTARTVGDSTPDDYKLTIDSYRPLVACEDAFESTFFQTQNAALNINEKIDRIANFYFVMKNANLSKKGTKIYTDWFCKAIFKNLSIKDLTPELSCVATKEEFIGILKQIIEEDTSKFSEYLKQNPNVFDNLYFYYLHDEPKTKVNTQLNFPLYVEQNDTCVSLFLKECGMWQPEIASLLMNTIKQGDKIIHLGGHIGFFDVIIGKVLNGTGSLDVFEPNPRNFSVLKDNLALNQCGSNVNAYPFAVYSSVGEKRLKFHATDNTGASHIRDGIDEGNATYPVHCVTLDAIFPHYENVNLLFMDVEGCEIEVLKGAKALLEKSPNCKILMEWCLYMCEEIKSPCEEFLKEMAKTKNIYQVVGFDKKLITDLNELLSMKTGYCDLLIEPKTL